MKKSMRPLAIGLTVLCALMRITQHGNFAPVGALSLFAGARLRGWWAWALPLALMALTDPLVGGYSRITPVVYLSFLISIWIGSRVRKTENPAAVGLAAIAGSVQFFLITNAFTWYFSYPHTAAGLASCFTLAIPFFERTLAADLLYSGVLFGLYSWLTRTEAVRSLAPAECPASSH